MITYGKILQELDDIIVKKAFIPSPNSQIGQQAQQAQQPQQSPAAPGGAGGAGPQAAMGGAPDQASLTPDPSSAQPQGGTQPGQQGQPQDPAQQAQQAQQIQAENVAPKAQAAGLKNTLVSMSVADLLDLNTNGKATQAHLKTESMKVKHQFEHQKMLREEQRKQEEAEMQRQQQAAMQQQQQSGMMGGGIYSAGPMDGSQPGQAPGAAPAQPGQPQPGQGQMPPM